MYLWQYMNSNSQHQTTLQKLTQIILSPPLLVWKASFSAIYTAGEVFWLFCAILRRFPFVTKNPDLTIKQMMGIGVQSLPIVIVTSLFTGMVAAVQAAYQFRNLVPDKFIGTAVCKMVLIELGPVLTGLVMAGRVGSALAAEIGSMKEKEELQAMTVLNLDPLRYLAMPRLLTFMVMMPALTLISMFLAIIGGWVVGVVGLDLTTYTFMTGLKFQFNYLDLFAGLLKGLAFGILTCLMGYHHGIHAGPGAKGVGEATMKVVVSSCVLILVFDFLITLMIFR
jgi:phospholipid/cholesterol/gamma-HCH transport system permease protein